MVKHSCSNLRWREILYKRDCLRDTPQPRAWVQGYISDNPLDEGAGVDFFEFKGIYQTILSTPEPSSRFSEIHP